MWLITGTDPLGVNPCAAAVWTMTPRSYRTSTILISLGIHSLIIWQIPLNSIVHHISPPQKISVKLSVTPVKASPTKAPPQPQPNPAKERPSKAKTKASKGKPKPFNLDIKKATSLFIDHVYGNKVQKSAEDFQEGLRQEGSDSTAESYRLVPTMDQAARFFRFYLDVPFGLAQIAHHGRAEARLKRGVGGHWELHAIKGDPYFGTILYRAIKQSLPESQVQRALEKSGKSTLPIVFKFFKMDEGIDRMIPRYYYDGVSIILTAFHVLKVECVDQLQRNCDKEIAAIESESIFKRLKKQRL